MGTYSQVGQQIDTSFEAAHEATVNFNAKLFGMVDQINKDFQANAEANRAIREKDALNYEQNYGAPLAGMAKTSSAPLNEKLNVFARDIGNEEYQQTLVNQRLHPDDPNYQSYTDASNSRQKAMLVPTAMGQAAGAMEYYKEQYNTAMQVTPGMPGSVNEKYSNNQNLLLVRDIAKNNGANITPSYNKKSGEVIWNYDDGEKKFSISNTAFLKGAQEGNSFLEFNGNPKDFVSTTATNLVKQVDGNKELKTGIDTKYKSVTGVSYSGGLARTEKAFQDYEWKAELDNPNMKNVARPMLEGLNATPNSIITVPKIDTDKYLDDGKTLNPNFGTQIIGEDGSPLEENITFQEAYGEQKNLQYIANGNESVDENGQLTPYAVRQRAIYKQAMIQEALKTENGFVKGDLQYQLTDKTKYVAPSEEVITSGNYTQVQLSKLKAAEPTYNRNKEFVDGLFSEGGRTQGMWGTQSKSEKTAERLTSLSHGDKTFVAGIEIKDEGAFDDDAIYRVTTSGGAKVYKDVKLDLNDKDEVQRFLNAETIKDQWTRNTLELESGGGQTTEGGKMSGY